MDAYSLEDVKRDVEMCEIEYRRLKYDCYVRMRQMEEMLLDLKQIYNHLASKESKEKRIK